MRWTLLLVMLLAGCSGDGGSLAMREDPMASVPSSSEPLDGGGNETVLTRDYVGVGQGPWALNTGCGEGVYDPGGPENIGGGCFLLVNGTKTVRFTAEDDVSANVGLYVRHDHGPEGFFCNVGRVSPPAGATFLMIMVDASCIYGQTASFATTGTITVTMYHP